jgi:monofunctional biosynthetic peptidoglycan transglycosylase
MNAPVRHALRLVGLVVVCAVCLQLYFLLRIAVMMVIDPQSTTFQRSEAWRLLLEQHRPAWHQEWVDYGRISPHLKRAVIASEDAGFTEHGGVDWEAMEKAWDKNQRAEARAARINSVLAQQFTRKPAGAARSKPQLREPKIIGGSTITQQLAKNLFLSSERTTARKAQELVITFMLEALLTKQRLLEIYLNNVEWGEGVFGAKAAARHYFGTDASQLGPMPAARLAVMLPAPKRFEQRPASPYIVGRAGTVAARAAAVELP